MRTVTPSLASTSSRSGSPRTMRTPTVPVAVHLQGDEAAGGTLAFGWSTHRHVALGWGNVAA